MDIQNLKPTKKIKISPTIDIELNDEVIAIADERGVKYSQAMNFIIKVGIDSLRKK